MDSWGKNLLDLWDGPMDINGIYHSNLRGFDDILVLVYIYIYIYIVVYELVYIYILCIGIYIYSNGIDEWDWWEFT